MLSEFSQYIQKLFRNVGSNFLNLFNFTVFSLINFFTPIIVPILAAIIFVLIDLLLGYRTSRRMGNKKLLTSKIWDTIDKLLFAVLLISGAHYIDLYIVTSLNLHLVEVTSAIICVTEFLSWIEHMYTANKNCKFVTIIKMVFGDIILDKSEKYLGKKLNLDKIIKATKKK